MNNPAVTNLVISLGAMQCMSCPFRNPRPRPPPSLPPPPVSFGLPADLYQVARKLPMDDPTFITYLRIAYVATQLLSFAIYFYITMVVSLADIKCCCLNPDALATI